MPDKEVLFEKVDGNEELLADVTLVFVMHFDDHSLAVHEPTLPGMLSKKVFCSKSFVAVITFIQVVAEHGLPLANQSHHLAGEVGVRIFFIKRTEARLDLVDLFVQPLLLSLGEVPLAGLHPLLSCLVCASALGVESDDAVF